MKAYIDESGDLGFTEKSTKHFVISLLIVNDERGVGKCIKNVRTRKLKRKYSRTPELKFSKSDEFIKECVLKSLNKKDICIHAIILKKSSVYDYLHDHKNKIYNYLTKFLVESIILSPNEREIVLVVDKFLSKEKREDYDEYVKTRILDTIKKPIKIEITHVDSQQDKCLQAVDFISGAIFNKYEFGNEKYYKLIESKIKTLHNVFSEK